MRSIGFAVLASSIGMSLLLLVAAETPPGQDAGGPTGLRKAALDDLPRFVFLAVIEGLYTDGVTKGFVRSHEELLLLRRGGGGVQETVGAARDPRSGVAPAAWVSP